MQVPQTIDQLLAIDPETLEGPLPWSALFQPAPLFADISLVELWHERRQLGLEKVGILGSEEDKRQGWATACHLPVTIGDLESERFRLRAVQVSIREHCGALHAAAVAGGRVERCRCAKCDPRH